MKRGSSSIMSYAGEKLPVTVYLRIKGCILFCAKKAPLLNLRRYLPLVVPPSGNIIRGENCAVFST